MRLGLGKGGLVKFRGWGIKMKNLQKGLQEWGKEFVNEALQIFKESGNTWLQPEGRKGPKKK